MKNAGFSLCLRSALSKVMFVQDTGKQAVTQISATFLDALSFHHDCEDVDEESSSLYINRGLYVEGFKKQISVAKY